MINDGSDFEQPILDKVVAQVYPNGTKVKKYNILI